MARIRLLQEEIAVRLMEQSNRLLFLLTVITVLALPINIIIAGFFGMNVGEYRWQTTRMVFCCWRF